MRLFPRRTPTSLPVARSLERLRDGANCGGLSLRGAELQNRSLRGANLADCNLEGAHLEGCLLQGALLHGARLKGAFLQGARLDGAELHLADLQGADLAGSSLHRATLNGAKLRRADLAGASLRDAQLFLADLRDVDLRYTDLTGTNLSLAWFGPALSIPLVAELERHLLARLLAPKARTETLDVSTLAVVGQPAEALRKRFGTRVAAALIYHAGAHVVPDFYLCPEDTLHELRTRTANALPPAEPSFARSNA